MTDVSHVEAKVRGMSDTVGFAEGKVIIAMWIIKSEFSLPHRDRALVSPGARGGYLNDAISMVVVTSAPPGRRDVTPPRQ
jgi:hypothetical protein